MHRLAVLSLHTSPLAQAGTGDGGGMNVYVRQLSSALARSGVECEIFTRATAHEQPPVVDVEPGLRVHHVPAGRVGPVPKDELPAYLGAFTEGVRRRLDALGRPDAIHANYWLSGVAGHALKHDLDVPLLSTFHTLARVKGDSPADAGVRALAEEEVIACSDAVLASCTVEASDIARLYGVPVPRLAVVPPGVDHAVFSPGHRAQARRALGLPAATPDAPMVLFVGRIQPLKGAEVAVRTLAALSDLPGALLAIVGGPSGPEGAEEMRSLRHLVRVLGLQPRVHFVEPVPHELLSTYYRAADVCVVPSRSESFGLVALEASACGTPVVAADVGGLRTLVDEGRTGFLVAERDPEAYADRVRRVLADSAAGGSMGAAASARAATYRWSHAASTLRAVVGRVERVACTAGR